MVTLPHLAVPVVTDPNKVVAAHCAGSLMRWSGDTAMFAEGGRAELRCSYNSRPRREIRQKRKSRLSQKSGDDAEKAVDEEDHDAERDRVHCASALADGETWARTL